MACLASSRPSFSCYHSGKDINHRAQALEPEFNCLAGDPTVEIVERLGKVSLLVWTGREFWRRSQCSEESVLGTSDNTDAVCIRNPGLETVR